MIETKGKITRTAILLGVAAVVACLIAAALYFQSARAKSPQSDPLNTVKGYLKANYARDYSSAYRYISSEDQRVWNETSYASQSASFTGFALELAQKLTESMDIWVIEKQPGSQRAYYRVGYRVPTADELSPLLFEWDPDKLNALSRPRQKQLLEALEKMKRDRKMIMLEGQETFDLVLDNGSWKLFFDWASGIKVTLQANAAPSTELEARFVQRELIVKQDEPFQIDLKIKNRSQKPVLTRIVHRIEPREMEDHIDMIACGALRPLALEPGDAQEISSAYLIRHGLGKDRKIAITYEFELEPFPAPKAVNWKTHAQEISANGS
ncbi:MAG TPA: cytochrome c oxidase assembly protein [Candidatus Binatia bacterium]|nr:cytochrome c oxidase assembly protein [Candidatus Binatia bacterium]